MDWSAGAVELLTETRPWPQTGGPRRAAVSSFGFSGTNAHIILEQAPEEEAVAAAAAAAPASRAVAAVGALGPYRRRRCARRRSGCAVWLDGERRQACRTSAFSLATARAAWSTGPRWWAATVRAARRRWRRWRAADVGRAVGLGRRGRPVGRRSCSRGRAASGPGWARELYAAFPVFAAAYDEVCAELDQHLPTPLKGADALLDETQYTQPALFALEVALFRLVESWGVRPDFLVGHSIGEIAASHCASVLSLREAALLVTARSRLMQALPAGGAMVAVQATEAEVLPLLTHEVGIAAVNGPTSVVISGSEQAVLEVAEKLAADGRKTKRLTVSHAFHSPLMDPMLAEFRAVVEGLTFNAPTIPIVSTLDQSADLTTPEYWVRHVREAVRFADAVQTLEAEGVRTFVELGPDGTLTALAQDCVSADHDALFVPTLRRDRAEAPTFTTALAQTPRARHHSSTGRPSSPAPAPGASTCPPTPSSASGTGPARTPAAIGDVSAAGLGTADHPLLGASVRLADADGHLFTGRLALDTQPWLADHAVMGVALLPGTAFVELAIRAGDQVGCEVLEELTLEAPLVLPERGGVHVQLAVGAPEASGRCRFSLHARSEDASPDLPWTRHATGELSPAADTGRPARHRACHARRVAAAGRRAGRGGRPVRHLRRTRFRLRPGLPRRSRRLAARGRTLRRARPARGVGGSGGGLRAAPGAARLRPAHPRARRPPARTPVAGACRSPGAGSRLHATGATELRARIRPLGEDSVALELADAAGGAVAAVESLALRPVSPEQFAAAGGGAGEALFGREWATVPTPAAPATPTAPATHRRTPRATAGTDWALLGPAHTPWSTLLSDSRIDASRHDDPAALAAAVAAGAPMPRTVLALCPPLAAADRDVARAAHQAACHALELVQNWLAQECTAEARLVLLTRGAVAARPGEEVSDLPSAALWGLVRSAQSENPGRFVLVDLDEHADSARALIAACALDEPQLAIREGKLLGSPTDQDRPAPEAGSRRLEPAGTVLLTGATGWLGGLLARHLVAERGVPAPAAGLAARRKRRRGNRAGTGTDRAGRRRQVRRLRRGRPRGGGRPAGPVPAEHPLTAVVHAAAVLDDAASPRSPPSGSTPCCARRSTRPGSLHELTEASTAGRLRPLLLRRRRPRQPGAGQLRRRQRLPGRAGRAPPRPGPAGRLAGLGPVGDGERHGRRPRPGRPGAPGARRRGAALHAGGPRPL